jgi:hypothetical protein
VSSCTDQPHTHHSEMHHLSTLAFLYLRLFSRICLLLSPRASSRVSVLFPPSSFILFYILFFVALPPSISLTLQMSVCTTKTSSGILTAFCEISTLNSRPLHECAQNKTNSVALSPQPNYTDLATATCRRNLVPTFVDRGVSRGRRG